MKIYKLIFLLAGILMMSSCDDGTDFPTVDTEYVSFVQTSGSFPESVAVGTQDGSSSDANNSFRVTIFRSTPDLSSDLTVNFSVSGVFASSSDFADAGDDASSTFTTSVELTSGNGSLTIPAGEAKASFSIVSFNDILSSGNKNVTVTITGTSDAGVSVGFAGGAKSASATIAILDDDCPTPSIIGTFGVVTSNTSPGGCEGVTNEVEVALVSENPDGTTTYSLSDVTGGLYVNCYGSADNPGEIVVAENGLDITLTDQPDVVYGGDVFNGSGAINPCDNTFTLSWSNGFGDMGTTVFSL